MALALPIQLVSGDTGTYPCLITGGTIDSAIFAIVVELEDGYSYDSVSGTIKKGNDTVYTPATGSVYISNLVSPVENANKIIINLLVESDTPTQTSHNILFVLDKALTECFKAGKYSYDISVKQSTESSGVTRYTPIYTNAFNVYPKTNKIIVVENSTPST